MPEVTLERIAVLRGWLAGPDPISIGRQLAIIVVLPDLLDILERLQRERDMLLAEHIAADEAPSHIWNKTHEAAARVLAGRKEPK